MLRKNQVPRYDDFLRLSGHSRKAKAGSGITLVHHAHAGKPPVLAVGNNRQVEHFGIFHDIPQKSSGIRKFIAVRDADNASFVHFANLCHDFPLTPNRHTAIWINIYKGVFLGFGYDIFHYRFIVDSGLCVRLTGNRRKTAAYCAVGNCIDILEVLMPRVTDIAVHVNQPRQNRMSADIKRLHALYRQVFTDFFNYAVRNVNIHPFIPLIIAADNPAVFQQCFHCIPPPI